VWIDAPGRRYMKGIASCVIATPASAKRSENADSLPNEISMQTVPGLAPEWVNPFLPTCLTPLPGLGIGLRIVERQGADHRSADPQPRARWRALRALEYPAEGTAPCRG